MRRASTRLREVAVRKIVGSGRSSLAALFLTESDHYHILCSRYKHCTGFSYNAFIQLYGGKTTFGLAIRHCPRHSAYAVILLYNRFNWRMVPGVLSFEIQNNTGFKESTGRCKRSNAFQKIARVVSVCRNGCNDHRFPGNLLSVELCAYHRPWFQ